MPLKWVLIFGRARVWTLKCNYLTYIITVSRSALCLLAQPIDSQTGVKAVDWKGNQIIQKGVVIVRSKHSNCRPPLSPPMGTPPGSIDVHASDIHSLRFTNHNSGQSNLFLGIYCIILRKTTL